MFLNPDVTYTSDMLQISVNRQQIMKHYSSIKFMGSRKSLQSVTLPVFAVVICKSTVMCSQHLRCCILVVRSSEKLFAPLVS